MKKLLVALLLVPAVVRAATPDERLAAYNRYFDCSFCGMMSLLPDQQVHQLELLKEGLTYYKKNQKAEAMMNSVNLPLATAIIYQGIIALSGTHAAEIDRVIKLIEQKIKQSQCNQKSSKDANDVLLQRSNPKKPQHSDDHKSPKNK